MTTLSKDPIAKEREAFAEAAKERAVTDAKQMSTAQRYDVAVHDAGEYIASVMAATGQEPTSSATVDSVFTQAGFKPDTETRMSATRLGRRLHSDRLEVARLVAQQATLDDAQRVGTATRLANIELERVIADPALGLEQIFAAVIAVRKATGHAHVAGAVSFESAVERAVQARSIAVE